MTHEGTGDRALDQILEDEAELKRRAFALLESSGLESVLELLCPVMSAGSAYEAVWRMASLIGQPEPSDPAPSEREAGRVAKKHSAALKRFVKTHAEGQDPEELVELIVESIEGANSRQILEGMDGRRSKKR